MVPRKMNLVRNLEPTGKQGCRQRCGSSGTQQPRAARPIGWKKKAMNNRIRKIALEEHFTMPGFESYSRSFTQHLPTSLQKELSRRLADFDELRLIEMDRAGMPGVARRGHQERDAIR
jgi:hypothetical protein